MYLIIFEDNTYKKINSIDNIKDNLFDAVNDSYCDLIDMDNGLYYYDGKWHEIDYMESDYF